MQYCDFASIMQIVRGGLIEGAFPNQMALVTKLFSDFLKEGTDDIFIDASQVNKWFHGTLKPSPSMSSFYAMDQINQDALADAFEDKVIPCLSDPAMVVEQTYELLIQDTSVSETKKQELIANREIADSCFLAAVLTFGMSRPFVARDIRKPEKKTRTARSRRRWRITFSTQPPRSPAVLFADATQNSIRFIRRWKKAIRQKRALFPVILSSLIAGM